MFRIDPATLAARGCATQYRRAKEPGVTTLDPSPREWRNRVRMTKDERERAERGEDPTTIRRVHCYDHLNRAVIVNGLGELVAVE